MRSGKNCELNFGGNAMAEQLTVQTVEELESYKNTIRENLKNTIEQIKHSMHGNDVLEAFKLLKFEKIAMEPLTGKPENLIEVINQSQTYLISIMAVEYLLKRHSDQTFIINWGNIPGYDIESKDGTIIAECFAATSYRSNGKLTADLKRLNKNKKATYKYEFFYDKDFIENHKAYYENKYPDIKIVKFDGYGNI